MAHITLVKRMNLRLDPNVAADLIKAGETRIGEDNVMRLGPGNHDVPDVVANHWFVAHHTDNPPPVEYPPGTPQYAQQMQERAARERLIATVELNELEDAKQEAKRRQVARRRGKADQPEAEAAAAD